MGAITIGRVRRSLLHFTLGKGLGLLLGLLLLLLLVRTLSTSDYGFYIATLALLEVGSQLSSLGALSAAQRYLPETLERGEGLRLRRLLWSLVAWRVVTLVAAAMLAYAAAAALVELAGMGAYAALLRLYLLVFLTESLTRYLDVVFDSLLLQGISQVSLLLRSITRVGGVLVLSNWGADQIQIADWIVVDAVAAFVGCVWGLSALWWVARRQATRQPGVGAPLEIRRYARFAWPSFLAASLYTLTGIGAVKLVAARLLSPTSYAAFGFAAALMTTLQRNLPLFLLIGMIRPLFVAARERPDFLKRLPSMAGLVLKLNVFVLLPLGVYVAVAGEALAARLTEGRYPEAGPFLFAFFGLLLAQALRGVASLLAQAMEDARAPLVGTALGLAGLVIGVLLAGPMGGIGLCAGMVISELIFAACVFTSLLRRGIAFAGDRVGYQRMALATLAASVTAGLTAVVVELNSAAGLGAVGIAAGLAYFGAAYVWKPFASDERETVNRLLKRGLFVW